MPALHRSRRPMHEINIVPYVDVMLVLLVIFMVTAPLITPGVVDLPSVSKAANAPATVLEVVIRQDRSVTLRVRDAQGALAEERRLAILREAARLGGGARLLGRAVTPTE